MAVKELQSSPRMLPLFARASMTTIPGVSRLPFLGGGRSADVPDLTLALDQVEVDRDRLAAYDRVCGFDVRDTLPVTFPHVLVFPLQLSLMTEPSFPFSAMGLVHTVNRITQHRPIGAGESLSVRVGPTPLEPHPRGTQFSMRSEVHVGTELVWEEASTYLRRGSGGGSSGSSEGRREDPAESLPASATWKLPGDLGRRYAAVSGDMNPIHMHPLSARLFGFPSAIVHGMWTKARCLAALESRLPDSFTVEVSFKRPILLPATVQSAAEPEGAQRRFAVRDARKGTPHLAGTLSSA